MLNIEETFFFNIFTISMFLINVSFSRSMAILYLRFGAKALQDNFVSELSTHYQNYILWLVFICAHLHHNLAYLLVHEVEWVVH